MIYYLLFLNISIKNSYWYNSIIHKFHLLIVTDIPVLNPNVTLMIKKSKIKTGF